MSDYHLVDFYKAYVCCFRVGSKESWGLPLLHDGRCLCIDNTYTSGVFGRCRAELSRPGILSVNAASRRPTTVGVWAFSLIWFPDQLKWAFLQPETRNACAVVPQSIPSHLRLVIFEQSCADDGHRTLPCNTSASAISCRWRCAEQSRIFTIAVKSGDIVHAHHAVRIVISTISERLRQRGAVCFFDVMQRVTRIYDLIQRRVDFLLQLIVKAQRLNLNEVRMSLLSLQWR